MAEPRPPLEHELLSAALLCIERPEWPRVEIYDEKITRVELCARIRDYLKREGAPMVVSGKNAAAAMRVLGDALRKIRNDIGDMS